MGLGVLQSKHGEHVPGTALLQDHGLGSIQSPEERAFAAGYAGVDPTLLKHRGDLILVPQPSDSPNDPLNWSKRRKMIISCLILFSCGLVGGTFFFHDWRMEGVLIILCVAVGPMVNPGIVQLATQYNVSLSKFNR